MTSNQKRLISEFAAEFGGFGLQVRAPMHKELKENELRSKRHTHLAIKWDELGNAFVLTANGQRQNLFANEI